MGWEQKLVLPTLNDRLIEIIHKLLVTFRKSIVIENWGVYLKVLFCRKCTLFDITNNCYYFRYYAEIKNMPAVSDQDMNAFLADESRSHTRQFHLFSALNELYKYLDQYKEQLSQALEEDEFARKARLPAKFAQMISLMDGDSSTPVIGGYAREEHV